ncbi:hypothetical protein N7468_008293 [Penicillium chermesinum]|uniref:Membrane insertase YidC/Oxa/ALB C-terminal domain-containing protein n=1 Tax=Penicillium chermesinum TaxID=63820 RepID=A0A9W9NPT3_9EURO|nr:uncharacterized protein N7468_008293 [Penicillium chermesinum]KAJ5223751.1 hypothetical protein N7468_008293 [Penicillium chermesinum]
MVGVAGLRAPQMAASVTRQRLATPFRSSRSISSFRLSGIRLPGSQGQLGSGLTKTATWRPAPAITALGAVRFNSTTSTAPSAAADANASTPAPAVNDLSSIDITSIPEHIGYLKELGLDYGWGFTATMEWLTEHIHLSLGFSWVSSIVIMGILTRAVLLRPFFQASDNGAKLAAIKHIEEPIRSDYIRLQKEGKTLDAQRKVAELRDLRKAHGISAMKSLVPMLQIPLGFGMYRLVNGMASLPVPALADESFLWITDLTVRDPTNMLPIISALAVGFSLARGASSGSMGMLNGPVGKGLPYILPGITLLFMMFQPAALQLYFASTGVWAAVQSAIVNSPRWRRRLGLAQFPTMLNASAPNKTNLERLLDRAHADMKTGNGASSTGKESVIDQVLKYFSTVSEEAARPNSAMDRLPPPPRKTEKELRALLKSEEAKFAEATEDRLRRNEERIRAHQKHLLAKKAAKQDSH